jgi:hypothetical protein
MIRVGYLNEFKNGAVCCKQKHANGLRRLGGVLVRREEYLFADHHFPYHFLSKVVLLLINIMRVVKESRRLIFAI